MMGTNAINGEPLRQGTPFRQPLGAIDPNIYGNSNAAGYGMSAGVKVGRQQNGPISRSGIGIGKFYAVDRSNVR